MSWLLQMQGKREEPDGDDRLGQVAKESGEALPEDKHDQASRVMPQSQNYPAETLKEQHQSPSAPAGSGLTSISSLSTAGPTCSPVQNKQQPLRIMQGRICNTSLQQKLRRSQCWLFPPEVHERDMKSKAVPGFSAHSSMTDL